MKLKGEIALVTGAASGIGRAIAIRFACEGATVVVNDLTLESAQRTVAELVREGCGIAADVSKSDEVRAMFAQVKDRYGRLDVLVNNAGIGFGERSELDRLIATAENMAAEMASGGPPATRWDLTRHISDESWERMIGVVLSSVFYCTREALNLMIPQGSGAIINISSAGAVAGQPGFPHYSAAKAGILGMTRAVAAEVAAHGIRVNAIAPGSVKTPLSATLPPSFAQTWMWKTPIARQAEPEEIATTALFLASDDSSYYTGQTLHPNGGVWM